MDIKLFIIIIHYLLCIIKIIFNLCVKLFDIFFDVLNSSFMRKGNYPRIAKIQEIVNSADFKKIQSIKR